MHLARGVEARAADPFSRGPAEAARPQLRNPRAQDRVVVDEAHGAAVARDVAVSREQAQQLAGLRRDGRPFAGSRKLSKQGQPIAGLDVARADLLAIGVEHAVMRSHVDDAGARLDAEPGMLGVTGAPARRGDRLDRRPVVAVPNVDERPGLEGLSRSALATQCHEVGGGLHRHDPVLAHHQRRVREYALVVEKYS